MAPILLYKQYRKAQERILEAIQKGKGANQMEWTTIAGWTISIVVFVATMASTHKNGIIGSVSEFWK